MLCEMEARRQSRPNRAYLSQNLKERAALNPSLICVAFDKKNNEKRRETFSEFHIVYLL